MKKICKTNVVEQSLCSSLLGTKQLKPSLRGTKQSIFWFASSFLLAMTNCDNLKYTR